MTDVTAEEIVRRLAFRVPWYGSIQRGIYCRYCGHDEPFHKSDCEWAYARDWVAQVPAVSQEK